MRASITFLVGAVACTAAPLPEYPEPDVELPEAYRALFAVGSKRYVGTSTRAFEFAPSCIEDRAACEAHGVTCPPPAADNDAAVEACESEDGLCPERPLHDEDLDPARSCVEHMPIVVECTIDNVHREEAAMLSHLFCRSVPDRNDDVSELPSMSLVGTPRALHVAFDVASLRDDTILMHATPRHSRAGARLGDETRLGEPTSSPDDDSSGYTTSRHLVRDGQDSCVVESWSMRRANGESTWCLRPDIGIIGGRSRDYRPGESKEVEWGDLPLDRQ